MGVSELTDLQQRLVQLQIEVMENELRQMEILTKIQTDRENSLTCQQSYQSSSEKALVESGLPTTVLRANFFMNHLLKTDCDNIDKEGWFSNPLGSTRNSFVCTNDIAEAAVVCLVEGPTRHGNKFYDLTGPQPQNMYEIAADLPSVLGKKVVYRPQSLESFEADFGPTRAAFFEYLANGFYTRCSPDFYNLTGKKPTAYIDYLRSKGAAGETGLEELYQVNNIN